MPKKRQPGYISATSPSSPATTTAHHNHASALSSYSPMTTSSPPSATTSSSTNESVTETLARLRREQTPRPSPAAISHLSASLSPLPSVPPSVRPFLLNEPDTTTSPPPPHRLGASGAIIGSRRRIVAGDARRGVAAGTDVEVAGPPAPRSWLVGRGSVHAGDGGRRRRGSMGSSKWREDGRVRRVPERFDGLSTVLGVGRRRKAMPSLAQMAMKHMARHWEDVVHYEQYNLAALPPSLKSDLLSYLTLYGPEDGISIQSLRTLFLTDHEIPGGTGSEDITHLDLTALVGHKFSVAELRRYFTQRSDVTDAALGVEKLHLGVSAPSAAEPLSSPGINSQTPQRPEGASADEQEAVAESWEDEMTSMPIPQALSAVRFPNLTHLSLSHPGTSASWSHLLSFSAHLPTLTHLSLAYWPIPTLTPNSTTASFVTNGASPSSASRAVQVGGTGYYSALDGDWHEAATLLRKLSNNTYCLRYLDLHGCASWLPALVWGAPNIAATTSPNAATNGLNDGPRPAARVPSLSSTDSRWGRAGSSPLHGRGPDWNGPWKMVERVNVSQGWVPGVPKTVRQMPASLVGCELLGYLRDAAVSGEDEFVPASSSSNNSDFGSLLERYPRRAAADGGADESGSSSFDDDEEETDENGRAYRAPLWHTDRRSDVADWLEREKETRTVVQRVRLLRSQAKGKFCRFEHGWDPPGR